MTERILFYTGRIHAIHDVRGKDGVGAKMDSVELERGVGLPFSRQPHMRWKDKHINIIDTPGHVDFTIEVERALRVLDGATFGSVFRCRVQSQSITVDRQMRRYNVPRIAFVNKCDRQTNQFRVKDQLRKNFNLNAVMVQYPIGLEDKHQGVVDLVDMRAYIFSGDNGEVITESDIRVDLVEVAEEYRTTMLDEISMVQEDDEFAEDDGSHHDGARRRI